MSESYWNVNDFPIFTNHDDLEDYFEEQSNSRKRKARTEADRAGDSSSHEDVAVDVKMNG